jgi:NAD(P)-dependent dehydrogenase (short-subunit alcohol dehydrogenase family)
LHKITVLALYAVASWAQPLLKQVASEDPTAHPSIIVTNSGLWNDPIEQIFALSLTKAAQHNLTWSLAKYLENDGIHVALLSPIGPVSPDEDDRNPSNIAEKGWELYVQERGHWSLEKQIA